MKLADVKIGMECLTEVSGDRVRVRVLSRIETPGYAKQPRFRVQRVDNGRVLEKTRAAAALHELPKLEPPKPKQPPKITVRFYPDEQTKFAEGELIFGPTDDVEGAKVAYRALKEQIKSGERVGIVRILEDDRAGWRYPKAPEKPQEPKKVLREHYEWALKRSMGYCLDCRDFEVEGVEPDAQNQKCDKCGSLTGYGVMHAHSAGLIQVIEPERPPEPPKPTWESKTKSSDPRRALVLGVVSHHFHGEYSATVILHFGQGISKEDPERESKASSFAKEALEQLNGKSFSVREKWEQSEDRPACIRCLMDSDALKLFIEELQDPVCALRAEPCGWRQCKDGGEHHKDEIGGCPHSIDRGPVFTAEIYLPSLDQQTGFNF